MNLNDVGQFAAIVAALAAVFGLVMAVRSDAAKRAEKEGAAREAIRTDAYAAGVQSQAPMISQLQVQLGDRTNERDQARQDARDWEGRYNDLRDRRRQ